MLVHLLDDDEIDAAYVRGARAHAASCPRCAAQLGQYRSLRAAMAKTDLRFHAPRSLSLRVGGRLSPVGVRSTATVPAPARVWLSGWIAPVRGFALGAALSAAMAATVVIGVERPDQDQIIVSDVVSAYLRSLKSDRQTDVESNDRQRVAPWFTGRLEAPPPVPDLSSHGIALVGGRLDYVRGRPVAALVYERAGHVFNLFVAQGDDAGDDGATRVASLQGVNVELWSEQGFKFCAVADVNADDLDDFHATVHAAALTGHG